MSQAPAEDPRYPIGRFEPPARPLTSEERRRRIEVLAAHPELVRTVALDLDDAQLDTPYREGGWTMRQLIHHLADSHLNAFCRFKLALTEEHPTIKPYDQDAWAERSDAKRAPVGSSLDLLEGLHARWVLLLNDMHEGDFARTLRHPEIGDVTLDLMLDLYSWHCAHHQAHLEGARAREGW